jgi:hypothetical protein
VPLVSVPRCVVCSSPHREQVEQMLFGGRSPHAIVLSLPDQSGISQRNIGDHYRNGHTGAQALAAAQSRTQGEAVTGQPVTITRAVEAVVEPLAAHLSLAGAIVAKVGQRLAAGDLEPDVRDGIAAAKLLAQVEVASGGSTPSNAEWEQTYWVLLDTAKAIMDPEQWTEFSIMVGDDPYVLELRAKRGAGQRSVYAF